MDGDTLYAWQVEEPDGRWSMVGALIPETGINTPLIHRSYQIIKSFEQLARNHAERTSQPLRLARFVLEEVLL
jgi:hypothetical protein